MSAPGSVLSPNATPLESALDLAFGRLLDQIVPPFPELLDPAKTPAAFLPYLAADRGVEEWRAGAAEDERRATVAASWPTKRQAGTRAALELAVRGLKFEPVVTAWHEQRPKGNPYSFRVMAWIDRDYDADVDGRLLARLNAAKSERDQLTIAIGISTAADLRLGAALVTVERVTLYPKE